MARPFLARTFVPVALKDADQSTTSTSLQSDSALKIPVVGGRTYRFRFLVLFSTAATTTGIALAVSHPGASLFSARSSIPVAADGTAAARDGWHTASDDENVGTGVEAASTVYLAVLEGLIKPNADGEVTLRFRSSAGGSQVTVHEESVVYCTVRG